MSEKLDNKFDEDYWRKRWDADDAPWQKSCYHPGLIDNADKLKFKGDQGVYKAFVPLCGKTLDMKWMYDQGFHVVGLDVALLSLEQFMSEHGIKYERKSVNGCNVLQSEDKRITLWDCNLFDFPKLSGESGFDIIWDRGSFVAINFDEREKYAKLMQSLVAPDFRYLMEWIHYDGTQFGGPPKTSTESEINGLFGEFFKMEILSKTEFDFSNFGVDKPGISYLTLFSPK